MPTPDLGSRQRTTTARAVAPRIRGVASCTINYSTGNVSIIFAAPIASGTLLYQGTFGGTSTDQTLTTLTAFGLATGVNPTFGPQEVVGTTFGGRTRTIGLSGDSIMTGNVNTQQNVSWADLSNGGLYGEVKISSPGETLAKWATPAGRIGRTALVGPGGADRILSNYGTNDITGGASLSTMINGFLASIPALAAMTPNSDPDNIWWVTLLPHVVSAVSNVPYAPSTGPYQAAGAALGPGAVANPTPLGAGVLTCTITGTGSAGPYSCPFGQATMIGALWSDGAYTTVIDTGSGGASATTLSGSLVSTGSNTPATGAVSLTFASALAGGQTVNLYTFASGPSERNAWNYFLYNWAVPKGKIGGVIDTASCVEASPASATGAGSGTWSSLSLTADGTHPNAAGHQTAIPGCIGPSGTTPSLFWNIY